MATIACPGCGLPRTDETAAAEPCPICGHPSHLPLAEEHDDEPDHDQPWIIDEPLRLSIVKGPPPPSAPVVKPRRGGLLVVGIFTGFVMGVVAGAAGVLLSQAFEIGLPPHLERLATTSPANSGTLTPGEANLTPRPRDIKTKPPTPVPTPESAPAPTAIESVLVGPSPHEVPVNPFRPLAPRAEKLDNPQVYAPFIPPGGQMVARGRVNRLIVSGLEKGAFLDCSGLESREVIVVGKIDGGSRLALFAPGGKVRFLARVDGRSMVEVRAPGGDIIFETPTERSQDGSRISGGSVVELLCRSAVFRGHITGVGTHVGVRLDPRGSLEFTRLDERARLEYEKYGPGEGTPKIKRGKVEGKAVLKSLD